MPDTVHDTPKSSYSSILKWSANWPAWQRDALRRIVEAGALSEKDRQELTALCRAKHGLLPKSGIAPKPVSLTAAHIPGGDENTSSVSLSKLSRLQNVGRLSSDQEIMFGSAPGLTVIYGENGAGKSGYARVIKKACKARGTPQDIKSDAFSQNATGKAKAKIVYQVGSKETLVDWTDGSETDPRLGNIFVFDSFSARDHVGKDGPACFKPRGLDVLPQLAKMCDAIKDELQQENETTSTEIKKAAQKWEYKESTVVGKLVNAINATTKPDAIDAAAEITEVDEKRLKEINATLNSDPKLKAAATAAAAKRIRTFAETANSRATSVDDTAMQSLDEAIKEAGLTAKAAAAAVGPDLSESDLPGSCNDVWRELWNAAKKFSEIAAYPDKPFPVSEAGAKCVLCQQDLLPEAIDRFDRFNKFVANITRKNAESANDKVLALKGSVDQLRSIFPAADKIKADLEREADGKFTVVEEFAKAVDARIAHAQKCLQDEDWSEAPALPASPCADLLELADTLEIRAKEELAAADPENARALAAERDELSDKKWLATNKDIIKAQIARYAHAEKLKKCQADCASRPLSDKAKELDELYVTDAFCKAFASERDALGLKTLPVSLSPVRVSKSESHFGILVDGAANANVEDIASEGEHRCIALAAFMAELSQASHKSAVVFDDPVSSLDHKRRYAIAARLMKEATERQVIVFTHDLAFSCDLESAARTANENIHYQHIEWQAGKPGRVLPGLVWDAKSFKDQMKALNEQLGRADNIYKTQGDTEYREVAMPVIGRIRGASERIIEQHLLNGVIKRHDSRIDVKNTPSLAVVTAEQWSCVHEIWKICSNIIEAHATPLSGPVNIPTPEDLKKWMTELDKLVNTVKLARASSKTTPADTRTVPVQGSGG